MTIIIKKNESDFENLIIKLIFTLNFGIFSKLKDFILRCLIIDP